MPHGDAIDAELAIGRRRQGARGLALAGGAQCVVAGTVRIALRGCGLRCVGAGVVRHVHWISAFASIACTPRLTLTVCVMRKSTARLHSV